MLRPALDDETLGGVGAVQLAWAALHVDWGEHVAREQGAEAAGEHYALADRSFERCLSAKGISASVRIKARVNRVRLRQIEGAIEAEEAYAAMLKIVPEQLDRLDRTTRELRPLVEDATLFSNLAQYCRETDRLEQAEVFCRLALLQASSSPRTRGMLLEILLEQDRALAVLQTVFRAPTIYRSIPAVDGLIESALERFEPDDREAYRSSLREKGFLREVGG